MSPFAAVHESLSIDFTQLFSQLVLNQPILFQ